MNFAKVKSVAVICLGNICRSPMGEVVLRDRFEKHGLNIAVSSGGTGNWHIGEGANPKTVQVLKESNYLISHSAKQVTPEWFASYDLFLAMDLNNYHDLRKISGASNFSKIKMFREFDPALKILSDLNPKKEVPDPYHGTLQDFRLVLKMVEDAADGFVDLIINQ